MKITQIESQRNRPGRKNLYGDGRFLIGVGAETLLKFGLRTGDEITPELLHQIERTEELLGAKHAALRYLSVRPRSEREIRDKLREKEFADGDIVLAVEDLKKAGLLNDAEFARAYIRNAIVLKPTGRALLRRKLLQLGVERGLAEAALEEVLRAEDQEREAARAAAAFVARVRRGTRKEDPALTRARLTSYLVRRGFPWEIVATVVKKVLRGGISDEGETGEHRL